MRWTRQPQEESGDYWFTGRCYLTAGVSAEIPKDQILAILTDLRQAVQAEQGLDCLQVYIGENETTLWIIDQVPRSEMSEHPPEHVHFTILFPHEYGNFSCDEELSNGTLGLSSVFFDNLESGMFFDLPVFL